MTKKMNRKISLGILLLAVVIGAGVAIESLMDQIEKQKNEAAYAELIPLVNLQETDSFHQKTDKTRRFININSAHDIDDEFYAQWSNHRLISERIKAYATGKDTRKPHMECSSRTGAMQNILRSLGHQIRSISLYEDGNEFRSHVFLEILNPQTNLWEIQDPG